VILTPNIRGRGGGAEKGARDICRGEIYIQNLVDNVKERDHLQVLGVDGRIITKCMIR